MGTAMSHDVIVLGLGAMGSAAAWHLARRGLKVLGLEQFIPGHDRGSSHGKTRVIRQAYFEHPSYVPLLLRSYELWRELEATTWRTLFRKTGAYNIGLEDGAVVRGSLKSAQLHGLPHRMLSSEDLRRELPFMKFRKRDVALFEGEAGALFVEDCVLAFQEEAVKLGAELRFGTKARLGEPSALRYVLTAGAWMSEFAPSLPLKVERQVMFWFDPVPGAERPPLFIWDYEPRPFYSIPDLREEGVKVAFHHGGEVTTPEALRREVGEDEVEEMRRRLAATIPGLNGTPRASAACMYTNTPDEHFAIGLLPERPEVAVASACSGHGFKFAAVVGEILADLVMQGRTRHPIDLFSLDRFKKKG